MPFFSLHPPNKEDLLMMLIIYLLNDGHLLCTQFLFTAPPVLSSFHFPDNLEESMRTSVTCSVISGDPPISLEWMKDGKRLADRSDEYYYHIVSLTEYVSSLIIENLNRKHSGNYTCRAFNQHSSTSYSSILTVKTKPFFILKPTPQTLSTDKLAIMDCQADGQPSPVIRWKYTPSTTISTSNLLSTESMAILSSPRIHVLENGSLMIKSINENDEGSYYCEANNGQGKSISSSTYLKIYQPPKIRPINEKNIVKFSERHEIVCKVAASFPIYVEWFKDKIKIDNDVNYAVREEDNGKFKISILTITSAKRNDSALFTCSAVNYYGHANLHLQLIVQEASDPPINLKIIQIRSRSITISWATPFNGNSPIIGYHIVYRTKSGKKKKLFFLSLHFLTLSFCCCCSFYFNKLLIKHS